MDGKDLVYLKRLLKEIEPLMWNETNDFLRGFHRGRVAVLESLITLGEKNGRGTIRSDIKH